MSNGQDPREIITPDAFSVSRDLLGLPLAHPWRRAVAILIDLVLIALLANAKSVLFALAGGTFLFWLAFRGRKAGLGSTMARATIGCGGATAVFVAVVAIWGTVFLDEDTVLTDIGGEGGEAVPLTIGAARDFGSMRFSEDTIEAEEAAARLVRRLEDHGVSQEQIREMLADGIASEGEISAAIAAIRSNYPDWESVTGRPAQLRRNLEAIVAQLGGEMEAAVAEDDAEEETAEEDAP